MVEEVEMNYQQEEELSREVQNLIPGLPDEIAMECLIRVPYKFHCDMKSVCHRWQKLISSVGFYEERVKSGKAEHLVCQVQHVPPQRGSDSSTGLVYDCARINNSCSSNKKEEEEEDGDDEQQQQLQDQNQNQNQNQQQQINSPPQYGLTIFNASNQTWQRIRPNFGKIPMFCQCVAVPSSGKLLLLGGWDPETLEPVPDVYVLDMIKGSGWKRASPMSVARSFFACAVVGSSSSRVYVAGGHDNQKNALKSAEVYDVEADEWKILPEMEEERDECMGMSWEGDDRFWVVSGYGTESQGRFKSDAECYDPETGCWSKIDGLWPFPSISPRGSTATITSSANTTGQQQQQCQWLWFLGKEQQESVQSQQQNGGLKDEIVSSIVQLPNGVSGTSPCVSVTTFGLGGQDYNKYNHHSQQQQQQRVFVMTGKGGRSSSSSSSICNECEGEGAFIMERDSSNGNIKWNHVHTPVGFSGLPYSASYLLI